MKKEYEPIKVEIIDFEEMGIETEDTIPISTHPGTDVTSEDNM